MGIRMQDIGRGVKDMEKEFKQVKQHSSYIVEIGNQITNQE